MWITATGCALGLAAGIRHALEPDHLAAVSALVTSNREAEGRLEPKVVTRYAAAWGAGHGLVLVVVGAVLFAARASMPERLSDAFELLVALMLVVLGARGLRRHGHPHDPPSAAAGRTARGALPFVVGLTHGLAGSGALVAAIGAAQPSPALGMFTMALYGLGAGLGMVLLAGAFGLTLGRAASGRTRVLSGLSVATSLASMVLGVAWGAPIVQRLAGA
jgi:cytochrome c biogenesis protein CcdA